MKHISTFMVLVGLAGCTDGQKSKIFQLGSAQHVKCWSGGVVIYEGNSTGKVTSEEKSDGYYFEDAATRKLVEISANCIFTGL